MNADSIFWFVVLVVTLIALGYALARLVETYQDEATAARDAQAATDRLHAKHREALRQMRQHSE
ncbi:hypothetical protein BIU82_00220 [Arthrobacter sp. SW1]|uniref:hypothetical protein n=1 Tax=Arthrobacter sp. SW1 TaxID=1920889 RepID=UPI000877DCC5|nr:hypothetical protein [Arthrobacter sp. SW1]OFI39542.1 hypothetical protein BIU82_00220 [Arthrobacter sp. SW1]